MELEPYLFFNGRCEEALEFYRTALGAEITSLMRFKDAPPDHPSPAGQSEKVMHGSFKVGGKSVMVSDGRCGGQPKFDGFGLSIMVDTEDEARRYFAALSEGGQVQMPLGKTFYSPLFGMVEDRFEMLWMILVKA